MTLPAIAERSFSIALHDADMFTPQMVEAVESVLLFQDGYDHLHFRVFFNGFTHKDFFVPVDEERDYAARGYDGGLQLTKVMTYLKKCYNEKVVAQ